MKKPEVVFMEQEFGRIMAALPSSEARIVAACEIISSVLLALSPVERQQFVDRFVTIVAVPLPSPSQGLPS